MYFKEIEYELKKEYILFDINSIVASVGGSMGLFLGFSCFGMLSSLLAVCKEIAFKVVK